MIKFQWHTMTDFAKKVLRKMGAVPVNDYDNLNNCLLVAQSSLFELSKKKAQEWPFIIQPDVRINQDFERFSTRIEMKNRYLRYHIQDHDLIGLDNKEYRKFLARHLSEKWAAQSEEIILEVLDARAKK